MSTDSQRSDSPQPAVTKSPRKTRRNTEATIARSLPALSASVVDAICEHVAQGKSLRAFCAGGKAGEKRPSLSSVLRWLSDPNLGVFQQQYARAREASADLLASEIIEISDTAIDSDSAQAARIRVDARKWVAAKLKPKQWGDNFIPGMGEGGGLQIVLMRYAPTDPKLIEAIASDDPDSQG